MKTLLLTFTLLISSLIVSAQLDTTSLSNYEKYYYKKTGDWPVQTSVTNHASKQEFDDLYYIPSKDTFKRDIKINHKEKIQVTNNCVKDDYNSYDYNSGFNEGYYYASRINRFYRPYSFSYYSPYWSFSYGLYDPFFYDYGFYNYGYYSYWNSPRYSTRPFYYPYVYNPYYSYNWYRHTYSYHYSYNYSQHKHVYYGPRKTVNNTTVYNRSNSQTSKNTQSKPLYTRPSTRPTTTTTEQVRRTYQSTPNTNVRTAKHATRESASVYNRVTTNDRPIYSRPSSSTRSTSTPSYSRPTSTSRTSSSTTTSPSYSTPSRSSSSYSQPSYSAPRSSSYSGGSSYSGSRSSGSSNPSSSGGSRSSGSSSSGGRR